LNTVLACWTGNIRSVASRWVRKQFHKVDTECTLP
jgi:hypothetical protein